MCFKSTFQQQKNLEGYVGFASLPNQVYRKSVKRGFEFTLMVVGKKILWSHLHFLMYKVHRERVQPRVVHDTQILCGSGIVIT